jgi:hypothetical protein
MVGATALDVMVFWLADAMLDHDEKRPKFMEPQLDPYVVP